MISPCSFDITYFPGVRDRLQHNHNHEFSDTLIHQLFQERQPSNFQRNTIPPLAIFFAINWSVGYWWRRSGYWKKSTFQLFPSFIKKVQPWIFLHTAKSIISRTTAIQPMQHYPPTCHILCNYLVRGYWWRRSGYWKKSTFQLFPSIIKKVLQTIKLCRQTTIKSVWRRRCRVPWAATVVVEPLPSFLKSRRCRLAAAIVVEPPPSFLSRRRRCGAAAVVVEPHQCGFATTITMEPPPLPWSCRRCCCWHAAAVVVELPPLSWSCCCRRGAITVVVEPSPS